MEWELQARRVAGTVSPPGNPPMVAADQGGGASSAVARSAGEEGGIRGQPNIGTAGHNNYINNYNRIQRSDAVEWKRNRKRKEAPTDDDDNANRERTLNIQDPTIARLEEEEARRYYNRWHVPPLGNLTTERPSGVFRLMGGQVNGASTVVSRDKKIADISRIIDTWDVQGGCLQEIGINWNAHDYSRNMTSWFKFDRREAKTITAHNEHENVEARQQGGVAQFSCKELSQYTKESEPDFRGLGRWCSWLIYAHPSHKTRLVSAYNLGSATSNYLGTIYQQHLRYIQRHGLNTTPHQMFMIDFLAVLINWRKAGERIIIMADMNEHILRGPLARRLLSLGLVEATHISWGDKEPNTHVSGSKPIDAVYHSPDIEVTATRQLSFHESVGDHRSVLIDITARSLIGTDGHKIVRPTARRLVCSNKKSVNRFIKVVEKELVRHQLHNRLSTASQLLYRDAKDNVALEMMESIDRQMTQILVTGERQCRKITKRPLPFSAPVAYWIHRKWAYQALDRLATDKCRNRGNARRKAKRAGLDSVSLTHEQCKEGIAVCNHHLEQLKTQALGLRKVHLRNCLIQAEDLEDKEKYKEILRIIEREEQRSTWRAIRRVTNDPQLGAITFVQRESPDGIINITNRADMCQEIQQVTERRFELAESASVTSSSLAISVGFLGNTDYAMDLIQGLIPTPEDVDGPTRLVIEEMQRLWSSKSQEHYQAFHITNDDYRTFWRKVNESTSSSISGLHFGVYKAAMTSEAITSFLADKLSVTGSYGCPPTRWACGLQVMLEKVAGVALVNKLRAILLMEADYNFFNKWVFGYHAINRLYEEGYIPEDQYSQRESTSEDARLDSRLTMDISRQLRTPLANVSVDADKCYDRINHIIMSLALLALVGVSGLVTTLLHPIQTMKFYQRTAWGDSTTYMGGRTNSNPLQGLCQGNGAAPACWLIISSILMHCYTRQGFGASILSPMSLALIRFLGEMYVDDTDLTVTKPHYTSAMDVKEEAQASVDGWAYLLNSSGGSLNPEKCYWWMVDYICINGEWNYAPQVDWELTILLPDGSRHTIAQQDVRESKKMLGIWSNPAGDDKKHLDEIIIKKYRTWIDRSKNGHLPAKLNWISYYFKLWAGMNYGLATLATPTHKVAHLLDKLDYEALPLLGVIRSIKKEWRNLPRAFGGIGLRNLAIEQFIGWMNMLLQHYGSPTTVGLKLSASLEALQLELGCLGNPLSEHYGNIGILATPCWLVAIWERVHSYKFPVYLNYPTLKLPRSNDICLVSIFLQEGYKGMELRRLNRCRLHMKAIFLSDISTAGGRKLEEFVFLSREGRDSTFKFARELPCALDWKLWDEFWAGWLLPNGTMPIILGPWIHPSHQRWRWYLDPTSTTLWEYDSDLWIKYCRQSTDRCTRGNARFMPIQTLATHINTGIPASVKQCGNFVMLLETGPTLAHRRITDRKPFWDFVADQGGKWMWDYVEGKHDDMSWIASALLDQSAVMVTDGSYNRILAPDICGAGWVLVSTSSKKMIYGAFHERSNTASSYKGELLGLTAIHHLISFVLEYYTAAKAQGSIHCDNKGALLQASTKRKRVRPRTKHADLIRNIRHIKASHAFDIQYIHVKAHQDEHFTWDELTLFQQLNVHCDLLAKQAIQDAISNPIQQVTEHQLLPREQAAIFVSGQKQTSDLAKSLRFALGLIDAKKFFTRPIRLRNESNIGGLGWSSRRFDIIDWHTLTMVLESKPAMYGVWLAKQTVGVCATRRQMARNGGLSDDRCPNCLLGPERSSHLNLCLDEGRSLLFNDNVDELDNWMIKNEKTDRELRYWLSTYLRFRGERTMCSLGIRSTVIQEIAEDIDLIGWTDFLHGRIPISLRNFQQSYCASINSRMNGQDWTKALVTKLLNISHSQWMYRNFSLHSKTRGHLKLTHQAEVLTEIAKLSECNPEDVPEESRFLLEVEIVNLEDKSLAHQEYWISAMKAALKAGRRCSNPQNRRYRRQGPSATTATPATRTTATQRRNLHRFRRRIATLEKSLREDLDLTLGAWRQKRPHPNYNGVNNSSNKRFRKPD